MTKRYAISRVTGNLVNRSNRNWPKRPADATSEHSEGSLDWGARQLFGDREALVQHLESMGPEWHWPCLVYRQWERDARRQQLTPPTLNELGQALGFTAEDFWSRIMTSITATQRTLATLKASLAASQVIDAALVAAADPERGTKDREMLLKIAGVLEGNAGVTVNVQQNNFSPRDAERAKTPLLQFQDTVTALDEMGRDAMEGSEVVEGEIVEEGGEDGTDNIQGQ